MSAKATANGIGPVGLLGVVFVTLKLLGYINWSWWWVTAPFWGGFAIVGIVAIIALLIALIAASRS